jgi:hypothetical protein
VEWSLAIERREEFGYGEWSGVWLWRVERRVAMESRVESGVESGAESGYGECGGITLDVGVPVGFFLFVQGFFIFSEYIHVFLFHMYIRNFIDIEKWVGYQ